MLYLASSMVRAFGLTARVHIAHAEYTITDSHTSTTLPLRQPDHSMYEDGDKQLISPTRSGLWRTDFSCLLRRLEETNRRLADASALLSPPPALFDHPLDQPIRIVSKFPKVSHRP